jgi:hypothetical protein
MPSEARARKRKTRLDPSRITPQKAFAARGECFFCAPRGRYHHSMTVRVHSIEFFRLPMRTRFPFRYGIANLTELPHLFVLVTVECFGKTSTGISADGLPPKWFTKNLDTRFEQDDLPEMLAVIRHAADLALDLGSQPNLFLWWRQLYSQQQRWASEQTIPPLLAGLGASLIERATIDACCRGLGTTLFDALKTNRFEIDLGSVRGSLSGAQPADFLSESPLESVRLRHTIGMADPLTSDEIDPASRLDDGLPHSLVDNIRVYGLDHFKIKLQGDVDQDRDRLTRIAKLLAEHVGPRTRFTLDANEQYRDIEAFRDAWQQLRSSAVIREFIDRSLVFVEQPLHRDHSLCEDVRIELGGWQDAPPIIIDESDASLDSLPIALSLGYSGTSHKNCKGIFKGLINAATIRSGAASSGARILSAEDLGNVGPVALPQDLAMVAALSIDHVERNGHHYFAGLSMFPRSVQQRIVENYPDLYHINERGFATLSVLDGRLNLQSVNASPFGVAEIPMTALIEPWDF